MDHRDGQHADDRQSGRLCLLGADDRVQRQGERGHELEQTLAEELSLRVRQLISDDPEQEAQEDVRRIRECARNRVEQDVSGHAPADPADHSHQDDADDREVLVVVGATGQQGSVQCIRRCAMRSRAVKSPAQTNPPQWMDPEARTPASMPPPPAWPATPSHSADHEMSSFRPVALPSRQNTVGQLADYVKWDRTIGPAVDRWLAPSYCAAFLAACAFSWRSFSSAGVISSSLIVSFSSLPVNRNGGS